MKGSVIFTGSGPILILTTYNALDNLKLANTRVGFPRKPFPLSPLEVRPAGIFHLQPHTNFHGLQQLSGLAEVGVYFYRFLQGRVG